MNVLVYSGQGSTAQGVRQTIELLRQHLSPYYAVVTISEQAFLNDPWMGKTAMLVFPGGADLPYCAVLNGHGNQRIQQYVRGGGKFLGFCAGGYYGSARVEFEVGDPVMEVSGARELAFFPGTCKGCVHKGFVYQSHKGSRAVRLAVNTDILGPLGAQKHATVYYNGGGMFMDASQYGGVETLARYEGPTDIEDAQQELAAAVYCKVGKGDVVLLGTHPEYTPQLMRPEADDLHFQGVVAELSAANESRKAFLGACLRKIGLQVNNDPQSTVPRLTPIYMGSCIDPQRAQKVWTDLQTNMHFVAANTFEDVSDTIVLHDENENDYSYRLQDDPYGSAADGCLEDLMTDEKHLKIFTSGAVPSSDVTPYFDMKLYFENLRDLYERNGTPSGNRDFGSLLCYGEVVTSTNTLLDSNPALLRHLPTGFTFTATVQVAGRGRGGNVWVSPKGVMATSVLIRLPSNNQKNFNIVTLQYLWVLAIAELIRSYGCQIPGSGVGYEDMPIRLKWPNDMYVMKPEYFNSVSDQYDTSSTVDGDEQKWAKFSGALVNSQIINGELYLVSGFGVNILNHAPSISLNTVLEKLNQIRIRKGLHALPLYTPELLLPKLMFTFGQLYSVFEKSGLHPFLSLYYKHWFHLNQRVLIDTEGNGQTRECVIKGITGDYGLLVAQDVRTNETLELQPDGNSFDFFKGLVYKKR